MSFVTSIENSESNLECTLTTSLNATTISDVEMIKGLDDDDNEQKTNTINLQDQEGNYHLIDKNIAKMSELVSTMIENIIPLPNVSGNVLEKVIQYITYHYGNPAKEIEKPLKSVNMSQIVCEWDAKYVDELDQEMLFNLIQASNYLDIKPLLDLTCAKVASLIKGRSVEEIRKLFNITNDFTPEEEESIRAENKWCEI